MAVQTAHHGGGLDAAVALALGSHGRVRRNPHPRLSQRLEEPPAVSG
jgi:hypothetical protein